MDVELIEDNVPPSAASDEPSYNMVQQAGAKVLDVLLLPGAYSIGATVSADALVGVQASVPAFSLDEHGNVVVGGFELGGNGSTGINFDLNGYWQHMPNASSVQVLEVLQVLQILLYNLELHSEREGLYLQKGMRRKILLLMSQSLVIQLVLDSLPQKRLFVGKCTDVDF